MDQYGTGKKTAPDGTTIPRLASPGGPPPGRTGDARAELARLRARVRELEVETTKLSTEREILQRAAKYFAGETNW